MIFGSHAIIYTKDAEADRAFFRDILKYDSEDAGDGWLIFALPPAELAFHPSEKSEHHSISFMTKDIQDFVATMSKKGVTCTTPEDQGWGINSMMTLPGGGQVGVYQPRHASPILTQMAGKTRKRPAAGKKAAKAKPKAKAKAKPKTAKKAKPAAKTTKKKAAAKAKAKKPARARKK